MELKNIHETKNLVFDRKEVEAEIASEHAPKNKEVAEFLSKKLSVSEEAVKIKGIYGKFGSKDFKVKANVYKSKEDKNKIERKTKKEIETEKKEAEAAKQAKEEKSE
jgi:ribosomal protein S24E